MSGTGNSPTQHGGISTASTTARDRIATKHDEIVTDEWRDPPDHLEPLQGTPHDKLRVGPFRLGCRADRADQSLYVLRIRKRGGDAYRGDDD